MKKLKKQIEQLMEVMNELRYIEELQSNIADLAKEAASLDNCSIDLFMELRNNSKIQNIEEEYDIIDISDENGDAPISLQEVFQKALSSMENKEKKKKAYSDNFHTVEYEITPTMCLKILDVINKELEKDKKQITKSIKSKISLF